MYKPKLSYIIHYQHSQDKIMNLRRIIDWIVGFSDIEIIVVEQDRWSKISHLNLRVNHIFLKSELPVNRSWAYNVGLKRCNAPIVIFSDSNSIMNPDQLIQSLSFITQFEVIKPYSKVIRLGRQESSMDFNSILGMNGISEELDERTICDGITIFRKESIMKIGGWNEDFVGSTGESEFQLIKIKKLLSYKQMDNVGYNLYTNPEKFDETLYSRNQQILQQYSNTDIETLNRHVSTSFNKIGSNIKYAGLI
jgi:hypothetical protein